MNDFGDNEEQAYIQQYTAPARATTNINNPPVMDSVEQINKNIAKYANLFKNLSGTGMTLTWKGTLGFKFNENDWHPLHFFTDVGSGEYLSLDPDTILELIAILQAAYPIAEEVVTEIENVTGKSRYESN